MPERPDSQQPSPRIARTGPGRFALEMPQPERLLLKRLLPQLRHVVEERDPAARRLFPTAYHDDPDKEREYQRLMGSELAAGRLTAIETVRQTIDDQHLDLAGLERWMEAINSLRLVLGTRLDVKEDFAVVDPQDPDAPAYAIYDYLGWLLEQAVWAISADLSN